MVLIQKLRIVIKRVLKSLKGNRRIKFNRRLLILVHYVSSVIK